MTGFREELLSQCKTLFEELSRIAGGSRISHMCKFVSLRRLCMVDLVEELGRNRAIKDEISIEQLNFFHSLVSLETRNRCWSRRG